MLVSSLNLNQPKPEPNLNQAEPEPNLNLPTKGPFLLARLALASAPAQNHWSGSCRLRFAPSLSAESDNVEIQMMHSSM